MKRRSESEANRGKEAKDTQSKKRYRTQYGFMTGDLHCVAFVQEKSFDHWITMLETISVRIWKRHYNFLLF